MPSLLIPVQAVFFVWLDQLIAGRLVPVTFLWIVLIPARYGFSFFNGEFDPGSGRTLAACLTHASRTLKLQLAGVDEWRTGE